ncbi:PD-(D/E)XK nuclease family protein [Sulfurovum sp. ST-21]|uniref:PD-(D/E)XK nuclease family protein n=1 Tax=Sulfurovum indicum TaxID=2779528 RepID=A0A7M1S5T5_9BACT|nr:PD-(D/E)XK nuclease family protein [Sulfurovum indicum]QOR61730.1 PD-(D/E)XK nuclease family protein [Sulfurovum indicum]
MNSLHIYPTSRAIRSVTQRLLEEDRFLPSMMRMDEFEQRVILLKEKQMIDPLKRILLLREAAQFEAFERLNFERELIRFFSRSEDLFKFYEELAVEHVDFLMLAEADSYAEFSTHLEILETLLQRYKALLVRKGLTDKAFIPGNYELNEAFICTYEEIIIHLEGYLSRFEMELLIEVAKMTPLKIHYHTSRFNRKMQERFAGYGIALPNNAYVICDIQQKKVLEYKPKHDVLHAEVLKVEERQEQIALAFAKIEEMVQSGISPEKIALILPDESFKTHFALFDRWNNLNFAMGYDYSNGRIYKLLESIWRYWQSGEKETVVLMERYGLNMEKVKTLSPSRTLEIEAFFAQLEILDLLDTENERVREREYHFRVLFAKEVLPAKAWLFLWMKALSGITIDDIRGGKVTVMGVLETRGVSFQGVVIVDFNEGVVPASSGKDRFLNTQVRAFASLPTRNDRESLQKQYYKRLLEEASQAVIIYSSSDNKLPSKFIYELGLEEAKHATVPLQLLYAEPSRFVEETDPIVADFDASAVTWSASRLKIFLECKRKYYYRYIQKIQPKEEEELNEGLFLHKVLEKVFEEYDSYESEEEMEKVLGILIEHMHPDNDAKASYQKQFWQKKLTAFIQQQVVHFKNGWIVTQREKEFAGEIGGLHFKGRIDRIDQNETHTLVLDYKSGSIKEANRTKNLEKLSDFQMSIYDHLLRPHYQNVQFAFLRILDGGEMEAITALEEKNALLEEHIVALKQTKSFVAEKCESLQGCKYCEFALMCGRGEYL